jgi:hypothetical protein
VTDPAYAGALVARATAGRRDRDHCHSVDQVGRAAELRADLRPPPATASAPITGARPPTRLALPAAAHPAGHRAAGPGCGASDTADPSTADGLSRRS